MQTVDDTNTREIYHALQQMNQFSTYLAYRLAQGKATAEEFLTSLTLIERFANDIQRLLGCRPAWVRRDTDRLCSNVHPKFQRTCPWPACRLGEVHQSETVEQALAALDNDEWPNINTG